MKKIFLFLMLLLIPINTFAKNSSIVMEMNSGRIMYQNNIDEKRLIASTSKIMTCILAIENKEMTDIVTIGDEILTMYGSNIYLEVGEKILLYDLLHGLMLRSGNDAAVSIATYVSGSEKKFVKLMNKKAKELGMTSTSFSNPSGLDDESLNYSSARDLAILYSYAYKNEVFRSIVSKQNYSAYSSVKNYYWNNRNEILKKYELANGGKTGYTPKAGRVLVTSASNDDIDLVAVSFSNNYDYENQINLYKSIFLSYKNVKLLDKSETIKKGYTLESDFFYPLKENEEKKIKMDYQNNYVYINLENENIGRVKLIKKDIKKENKLISLFKKILNN